MAVDRSEFEQLYRLHFRSIARTAFLLTGSREEALDLAQETFARAYARWELVSRHDEQVAWLQRVVTNLALSWHRRQRVRARNAIPVGIPAADPPTAPEPSVLRALMALTPAQRAVVVLRFYADQSVTQVAETLGKRPGTVRALTSQALARLRLRIEPEVLRS